MPAKKDEGSQQACKRGRAATTRGRRERCGLRDLHKRYRCRSSFLFCFGMVFTASNTKTCIALCLFLALAMMWRQALKMDEFLSSELEVQSRLHQRHSAEFDIPRTADVEFEKKFRGQEGKIENGDVNKNVSKNLKPSTTSQHSSSERNQQHHLQGTSAAASSLFPDPVSHPRNRPVSVALFPNPRTAKIPKPVAITVHLIKDGITESPVLREMEYEKNEDIGNRKDDNGTILWMVNMLSSRYMSKAWCSEFKSELEKYQKEWNQTWPTVLIETMDTPMLSSCPGLPKLVGGTQNVRYSIRSIVKGRNYDPNTKWVTSGQRFDLQNDAPKNQGEYRHRAFGVRTDTIQVIRQILNEQGMKLCEPIETKLDRPIDVSYAWKHTNYRQGSAANLRDTVFDVLKDFEKRIGNKYVLQVGQAGDMGTKGRDSASMEYVRSLLHSKIAVVAQRDKWEDHWRLNEALVTGCLVLTDRMLSLPKGFKDGESVVEYTSADDLTQKIEYYLTHSEERTAIAGRGRYIAMSRHRSWHLMEETVFGEPVTACDSENGEGAGKPGDDTGECNPYVVHANEMHDKCIIDATSGTTGNNTLTLPNTTRVCLIHIGKTAGSRIACELGMGKRGLGDLKCNGYDPPPSVLKDHFVDTTHMNGTPRRCEKQGFNTFLITFRDPIDRIVSWFHYAHPDVSRREVMMKNANPCRKLKLYKYDNHPLGKAGGCFFDVNDWAENAIPPWERGQQYQHSNANYANHTEECIKLAYDVATGKRMCPDHNGMGYKFYADRMDIMKQELALKGTNKVAYLAMRNEYLAEDWDSINNALFLSDGKPEHKNGTARFSERTKGKGGEVVATKTQLSEIGRLRLCTALCEDIQSYKTLLNLAENLSERDRHETLSQVVNGCPDETYEIRQCRSK